MLAEIRLRVAQTGSVRSHGAVGSLVIIHVVLVVGLSIRVMLRPLKDPATRLAWIVVLFAVPYFGVAIYLLFGEARIGRRRAARIATAERTLPQLEDMPGYDAAMDDLPDRYRPLFDVGLSVSGLPPFNGNRAELTADSNDAIDRIVADIDTASDHVHVSFYIWLDDNNGRRVGDALMRAVSRGVVCRALVDDLGSRRLVRTPFWREMGEAGVHLGRALSIGNPLFRALVGRIDLRNHRKIIVVDNAITYCGSQNCADPEFRHKAKFAPWFDVFMRLTGPIVRQNQLVFCRDWMATTGEDLSALLTTPISPPEVDGFPAQVITSGPTDRVAATPEIFDSLMYAARRRIVVTTPYYVPPESTQIALCAAARRGVDTTIIFPARNDDAMIAAASRSYYPALCDAGVRIFEFRPGLLHTKSITVDGAVTLFGSTNLDRRSFDLNYENNVILCDTEITAAMLARQESYLAQSREITRAEIDGWSRRRQLVHNTMAILGPLL